MCVFTGKQRLGVGHRHLHVHAGTTLRLCLLSLSQCCSRLSARISCHQEPSDNKQAVSVFGKREETLLMAMAGSLAHCRIARLRLLVCKARRPADFLHSGDLSALDMRYLPWIVGSRSLLQCRSSSWGVQGCGYARLSGMQYLATPCVARGHHLGRESVLYLRASNSSVFMAMLRRGCTMVRHLRARLTAERADKLRWRSLRGSV